MKLKKKKKKEENKLKKEQMLAFSIFKGKIYN